MIKEGDVILPTLMVHEPTFQHTHTTQVFEHWIFQAEQVLHKYAQKSRPQGCATAEGRAHMQQQKAGQKCNSRKQGKSATAESRAKVQQQKAGQKCNSRKQGKSATAESRAKVQL